MSEKGSRDQELAALVESQVKDDIAERADNEKPDEFFLAIQGKNPPC